MNDPFHCIIMGVMGGVKFLLFVTWFMICGFVRSGYGCGRCGVNYWFLNHWGGFIRSWSGFVNNCRGWFIDWFRCVFS